MVNDELHTQILSLSSVFCVVPALWCESVCGGVSVWSMMLFIVVNVTIVSPEYLVKL